MARAAVAPLGRLNEAEYTGTVLDLAGKMGWQLRYHTYRSKKSHTGFPDWVLINEQAMAVVVVELKGWDTKVQDDQVRFVNGFRLAGVPAFVSRPWHWPVLADYLIIPRRPGAESFAPLRTEDYEVRR